MGVLKKSLILMIFDKPLRQQQLRLWAMQLCNDTIFVEIYDFIDVAYYETNETTLYFLI